jgi:hypothetical protein
MASLFMGRYWRGDGPLWKIYWLYGVLGSVVVAAAIVVPMVMHWIGPAAAFVALLLGVVYTIWILVGVWRCAFNIAGQPLGMDRDGWGMLARMLTVAWAINVIALSAVLFDTTVRN